MLTVKLGTKQNDGQNTEAEESSMVNFLIGSHGALFGTGYTTKAIISSGERSTATNSLGF